MLTVVIVAAVIAVAALAKTGPIKRATADLGIQAKSEGYPSLYFAHPGYVGLPTSTSATGPVRDRIAFGIQNEEHRAVDYSWTIQFNPQGRRYSGVTHVGPRANATIVRTVTLPCGASPAPSGRKSRRGHGTASAKTRSARLASRRVNVRVSLGWPNDSIDFWQECNA